jgi:hypothetical protein
MEIKSDVYSAIVNTFPLLYTTMKCWFQDNEQPVSGIIIQNISKLEILVKMMVYNK